MTHQSNKQFNTYKEGLNLEFLRKYCMKSGKRHGMEHGKTLEDVGELSGLGPSVKHLDKPEKISNNKNINKSLSYDFIY